MLRKGQWKYIHYVGFEPELFDLKADPKDIADLAQDPNFATVLPDTTTQLRGGVHIFLPRCTAIYGRLTKTASGGYG